MDTDHLAVPSGGEHRSLERSHSVSKDEVTPISLSASASASAYRQLRQHRNSWPTIEVAATAAAKAIKRKYEYTLCLKKGTPMLSIVTLKGINGFQRFLAQIFLTQLAIKR